MIRLYNILGTLIGPPLVLGASLKGRFGGCWRDRLGLRFTPSRRWMTPRIWFHAASVGESRSAAAVIKAVLAQCPNCEIYLSVNTPAGLETARGIFSTNAQVTVMAAPLDFGDAPQRALARIKPDVLVIMETELWPALIYAAKNFGATLILAAGRMTKRSFKRYKIVPGFMSSLLKKFACISTVGETEKNMFAELGAIPDRLICQGNPKFDGLYEAVSTPDFCQSSNHWRKILWGDEDSAISPLIVAGSTHPGEENLILEAFISLQQQRPDARLILAPRHLTRVSEIVQIAADKGFNARLCSAGGPVFGDGTKLAILDVMGVLSNLYSLAAISVVGGSLCPNLMGHNPLEPAAVASPMLFGPHMKSFACEAEALLQCGGAKETNASALMGDLLFWLNHPENAKKYGENAQSFLRAKKAVAPVLAELILSFCPPQVDLP